jgi:hypothetical protein
MIMETYRQYKLPSRILIGLFFLVLCIGLVCICPLHAFAHEIDPETWIGMRKMMRHKGPVPTIAEDIAALAGPGAKQAGPRLIDRGADALPAIHAALRSPGVDPRHALHLLQVTGSIGDKSSVPIVLELLRRDRTSPLRRDALLVLALLPATKESAAFVTRLAGDGSEPWRTRRMAFTWFGLHRDPRGRGFAEALRADSDPEKRAAALFVLARLGDATVLEPIGRMLTDGPPASLRDALMFALAEVATPVEFERRAPSSLAWSNGYKDALLYARYRAADTQGKIPLCRQMLRSSYPEQQELAVRCLLENGHARDLRPYAAVDLEAPGRPALLRNEIRKAGWRIIDTDDTFDIVPANPGT